MDPNRDTPLKRFGALWIGLFLVLSFGLAAFVFAPIFSEPAEDEILQAQYQGRLITKAAIDKAQQEQLEFKQSGTKAQVPPRLAFDYTAKQLLEIKPQVVKTPAQVVPGSPTAERLATQQ